MLNPPQGNMPEVTFGYVNRSIDVQRNKGITGS
jgi:hypothetical protein